MKNATMSLLVLATLCTGCQQSVRLDWKAPTPAASLTPVYVGDLSADKRQWVVYNKPVGESIGNHTFTVFAIPVGNINAHPSTPLKSSFDRAVRDALKAAGYDPRPASEAPAGTPILTADIRQCCFWSYMYFWPVIVQGGEVKVAMRVQRPDGTVAWQDQYKRNAPGLAVVGSFGFDWMVKDAMTKMVSDISKGCSGEEFRRAVTQ